MARIVCISILAVTLLADAALAFVCERSSGGNCVHWTDHTASLQSFLGSPGQALANGTTSWDQNAMSAANDWGNVGADFHFNIGVGGQFLNPCDPTVPGKSNVCANPAGNNPIYFSPTQCGIGFGDAIELTLLCWSEPDGALLNAAVLVNNNVGWNAYDGPLRAINGQFVYDIRRVLLHEFGHALGLDHPDKNGQTVAAIMNSRVSDLDRLQPDDIRGILSIYNGGSQSPSDGNSSSGASSGCQIGTGSASAAWVLLLPLCLIMPLRRRR